MAKHTNITNGIASSVIFLSIPTHTNRIENRRNRISFVESVFDALSVLLYTEKPNCTEKEKKRNFYYHFSILIKSIFVFLTNFPVNFIRSCGLPDTIWNFKTFS